MSRVIRKINFLSLLVTAAAIGLWELAYVTNVIHLHFFPSPPQVASALYDLVRSGEMSGDLWHTVWVTFLSGAIAIVLGGILGSLVGLVSWFYAGTIAAFDVLRSLPIIALMPIAVLIWGPTDSTEVYIVTFGAIWPMLVNTWGAVGGVHPRLREVARTFRFTRADEMRKIVIPSALPGILVGARLAIVNALLIAVTAEIFVNPKGLGYKLFVYESAGRPDYMWAYVVACGMLGYVLNMALVQLVRIAQPGGLAGRRR